ncbi:GntR family transcriptional regulator [uncultured Rubinisphaera sp.]|uniref:GntR family transcriptional regulator n=1 Tax=uncultured Rubinisphaera sp. TaxID=1678686 RepID=UPI0030DA7AE0
MSTTHSRRAYDHLKSKLISGELAPGSRILYGPVGKELGISATPVREAIGMLVNEGFVDLVPQLGAVVRKIEREELIELYEMREALEPYVAEKAAERMSENNLQILQQHYLAMQEITQQVLTGEVDAEDLKTIKAFEEHDLAFHKTILDSCGNEIMIRTVENSHVLTRIFSTNRHRYDSELMHATCEDHERILKALLQGDAIAAQVAMRRHIRNGLEVTLHSSSTNPADRRWRR